MPRIIYGNIIWFVLVMTAMIFSYLDRSGSEEWLTLPDTTKSHHLIFILAVGSYFIAAIIGILNRKKWGYEFTVSANYLIAFLPLIPVVGLAIYGIKSEFSFSEIPFEATIPNIENIIAGIISLLFALIIRRKNVRSEFENM